MYYINYKSDLTPNPGPGGGDVNDVKPPAGSAANLGEFCGPGGGLSPFLNAFIIEIALSGVKSSCKIFVTHIYIYIHFYIINIFINVQE